MALAGGILVAAGSAAAAILPTRMRAATMYMIVALVNSATLCVCGWTTATVEPTTLGVTLYLFTIGTCYAMFTAVVLEFLGHSGKSGSGRYSIINSLGNVPVQYMLLLDGWGGDKWAAAGWPASRRWWVRSGSDPAGVFPDREAQELACGRGCGAGLRAR